MGAKMDSVTILTDTDEQLIAANSPSEAARATASVGLYEASVMLDH